MDQDEPINTAVRQTPTRNLSYSYEHADSRGATRSPQQDIQQLPLLMDQDEPISSQTPTRRLANQFKRADSRGATRSPQQDVGKLIITK